MQRLVVHVHVHVTCTRISMLHVPVIECLEIIFSKFVYLNSRYLSDLPGYQISIVQNRLIESV